jgi:hypothetical protein
MAEKAKTAASETPPTEKRGFLSRLVPTWRDMAIVTVVSGLGLAAQECGLNLADRVRDDARADMAACLNTVRGVITEKDIDQCEEYGFSKLGTD